MATSESKRTERWVVVRDDGRSCSYHHMKLSAWLACRRAERETPDSQWYFVAGPYRCLLPSPPTGRTPTPVSDREAMTVALEANGVEPRGANSLADIEQDLGEAMFLAGVAYARREGRER